MTPGGSDLTITVGGELGPYRQALSEMVTLARTAGDAAATAMKTAGAGGDAGSEAFTRAAYASRALADAMATTTGAAVELDKELQRKQTDAGTAAQSFQQLGQSLTDAGTAMVYIGGALSGVSAGLIEIGTHALKLAGNMEEARTAMTLMSGSVEKTDTLIKGLVDFALRTPFEIPGVVAMAQKLVGFGVETEKVIPLLRTLGDVASGSGHGFAGLNSLVQDFGKMINLGVVHLREINILANQGVPAIQALADAYQVSTAKMRQMIEQNLVKSVDAMPILIDAMNAKFGGAMELQAATWKGIWSNFQDSISKTFIAIGDALIPVAKTIINSLNPILDSIQAMAEWFGKLPAPIQNIALAFGAVATVTGPLVLALGGITYVVGQILTTAPALLAFMGVELPAAAVTATTAVEGMATATSTAAITMKAALMSLAPLALVVAAAATGAAIGWAEGMAKIEALQADFVRSTQGMEAAAAAMGKGMDDQAARIKVLVSTIEKYNQTAKEKLELPTFDPKASDGIERYVSALDRLVNKIPGYKTQFKDLSGAIDGVTTDFAKLPKALGEFTSGGAAFDVVKQKIDAIKEAQADANAVLDIAQATYKRLVKEMADGIATQDEVNRAYIALQKALKDAHPEIGTTTKAFDAQALSMQTTGIAIEKYIKLWGTIPWEVWTGSVQEAAAAIKEKGISIDKTVAALKKMADALEGPASTSAALKAQQDEIIGNINQLEGLKRAIEAANTVTTGWHQTLENGVIVWREASKEATGFTTTMENGVLVTRGAKEALDSMTGSVGKSGEAMIYTEGVWKTATEVLEGLSGAAKKAADSTESLGKVQATQQAQVDLTTGKLNDHATSLKRVASQATETGHVVSMATDKMKGSFMEGMNGMTVSGETFIAMLAQMGALSSQISLAARALGYIEIGNNNFISPEYKKAFDEKEKSNFEDLFGDLAASFGDAAEILKAKMKADADALADHTKAVETATGKYDDVMIQVNGLWMTVKESQNWWKDFLSHSAIPYSDAVGAMTIGSKQASDALGGLATAASSTADDLNTALDKVYGTTSTFSKTTGTVAEENAKFAEMMRNSTEDVQSTVRSQITNNLLRLGQNFYDATQAAQSLAYGMGSAADVITSAVVKIGGSVGVGAQQFVSTVEPGTSFSNEAAQKAFDEYQAKINAEYQAMMDRSAEAQRVSAALASGQTSGLSGVVRDVYGTLYDFNQQVNGMVAKLTPNGLGGFNTQWVSLRQTTEQLAEAQRKYEEQMEQERLARNAASAAEQKRLQELSNAYTDAVYSFGHNSEIMTYEAYSLLTFAQQQARNANNPLNDPQFSDLFPQPNYGFGINGTNRIGGFQNWTGGASPAVMMQPAGGGVTINVSGNNIMDQNTVNSLTNRIATQFTTILRTNAGLKV